MTDWAEARIDALLDLIRQRRPIQAAVDALAPFPAQSNSELVILTRADAAALINALGASRISEAEARGWGEALELREDVGFQEGSEEVLSEFIFMLATPEISKPLTATEVERWRLVIAEGREGQ